MLKVSYRTIGDAIGINYESIRKYLQGLNQPGDEGTWLKIDSFLKSRELLVQNQKREFSTDSNIVNVLETRLPYNTSLDSVGMDMSNVSALATKLIGVEAEIVQVGSFWSAKRVAKMDIQVSALLGTTYKYIVLVGDFENLRSGMAVSFLPTDMVPENGSFALFQSLDTPENYLFGYVNPQTPLLIQTGGEPRAISSYKVVGFATSVSWGLGEVKKSVRIEIDGITPLSRV